TVGFEHTHERRREEGSEMTALSVDTLVVASCDSHVSPPMSYLRPYCEKKYLDDFNAFVKEHNEMLEKGEGLLSRFANAARDQNTEELQRRFEYMRTDFSDPNVRVERMDHERIAVEVVFHGTGQEDPETGKVSSWPIPWQPGDRSLVAPQSSTSSELATAGRRM